MKLLLITALAVFLALPAHSQGRNCGPRDAVVARLADQYGETRQSFGMGSNSALVEVFASIKTGSWTITVTQASGLTCLVAHGQDFENLSELLPPKGDDI